ncbi:GntR family transcriptional regulator [Halovulum dunhuangense]|uniref:GntR family transcriptional regulator n=1 Tax=Halovulum dunhuangense TaxID=1505036 RepID=A0A849L826_9RHOB|nr:GntR family transcriptional regulator [Halovulum dunhuangense]NNU82220.1 GntR family transcriptional regulator [Halovulum dunhuangense]
MQDDTDASMPRPPVRELRRAPLHEQVAERLRELIVHGQLKPGERISEQALCDALDISRTPLREAIKSLAVEGLIELRPNRSAVIAPLRREQTLELFEVIAGMERIAAEHAALRLTPEELRRLDRLQTRMEACHEAGDLKPYFALNQEIHERIVAGAHNAVLVSSHGILLSQVSRARYFALFVPQRWQDSVMEHRMILDALKAHDAAHAGALMRDHVWRTGQIIADAIEDRPAAAS